MDRNGSIKVDVGLGAKAELRTEIPSEASGRAVQALVDAISPFTEVFGLIGDHIRAVRTSRAIDRLEGARRKLESAGRDVKPVPDSFLIPWIEKTSQEDGEDTLKDKWENLLVSASIDYLSRMKSFPSILSELTSEDVKFLDEICTVDFGGGHALEYSDTFIQSNANSTLMDAARTFQGVIINENKFASVKLIMDSMSSHHIRCRFAEITTNECTKFRSSDHYSRLGSGMSVMMKNGLLEDFTEVATGAEFRLAINFIRLTRLGFEFVKAARGTGI